MPNTPFVPIHVFPIPVVSINLPSILTGLSEQHQNTR